MILAYRYPFEITMHNCLRVKIDETQRYVMELQNSQSLLGKEAFMTYNLHSIAIGVVLNVETGIPIL